MVIKHISDILLRAFGSFVCVCVLNHPFIILRFLKVACETSSLCLKLAVDLVALVGWGWKRNYVTLSQCGENLHFHYNRDTCLKVCSLTKPYQVVLVSFVDVLGWRMGFSPG